VTDDSVSKPKALVIGIGNEHRADDAFGLFVVRRLAGNLPDSVITIEHSGEGASLMGLWSGYSNVILIDAVCSGAAPGTVYRLDASADKIPARFFHYSTHEFGLAEAVEMARVLNQLPPTLVVFGVEGTRFDLGEPLSREVKDQIDAVVDSILSELDSFDLS
jgi:hydrogenase maturation protease